MTYTDPTSPLGAAHAAAWELCDHCQAPLAERQRYCVVCGARRVHADDPAARYFVEQARRVRAGETAPVSRSATASSDASRLRFALVFALLPLVAALGIFVGRGNSSDQALVDALKAQKAPIVNVIGGGAAASDTSNDGGSGSGGSKGKSDPAKGDVIAKTRYGTARSLTDSRVTPQQLEESRRALRHIVESKGRAYVEQQRDLPDQIVIP